MTATKESGGGGSTAERVGALLLAFGAGGGDHSVSDLARAVGRERSQVSRMLKALARSGLVEQDEIRRTYRLSWELKVLAAGAGDQLLVHACAPVLQTLVARTGEVALLSVQEGNRCLTVLREESHQSLRAGGWVGRRSPLHCTASGRALLLDSDRNRVEALTAADIGSDAVGRAPQSIDELLKRLAAERRRGFCVASEEVEVGLTSIGAPIRDGRGRIVGALNVSGPTPRLRDRVDATGLLLVQAARAVGQSAYASKATAPGV